jgi:hypothetical protein
MSNTELCKYYLGLPPVTDMMNEVSFFDIITALDQHFNRQWTWEIADEKFAMDNSVVCTTVTVYTPGRVLTGRSLCKIKDYNEAHLRAIVDACNTFTLKSMTVNNSQTNISQNQQMTPEQIMAAVGGQNPANQPVNSIPQMANYKDQQGIPNQGVPFDQITDNCHQEMQQEMGMVPQQSPMQNNGVPQFPQQPQQNMGNIGYDEPNPQLKGFTQRQIDRLNQIKKDFEIVNDAMFDNYVQTWNPAFSKKSDIIPSNVESFLTWAEDLVKNMQS